MFCLSGSYNRICLTLSILTPYNYGYFHMFVHFSSNIFQDYNFILFTKFEELSGCVIKQLQ
jgi:hypothetical protein